MGTGGLWARGAGGEEVMHAPAGQQAAVLGDEDVGHGAVRRLVRVGVVPRVQRRMPQRQHAELLVKRPVRLHENDKSSRVCAACH